MNKKRIIDSITQTPLKWFFRDALKQLTAEFRRIDENNKALDYLSRILKPLEPWTGWTMHPSGILTIVNDILINNKKSIVECGSGLSTLYAAKAVILSGGELLSFESDLNWCKRINNRLKELGINDSAKVIHADLKEWKYRNKIYNWYNEDVVRTYLDKFNPIDLLVIDGPPHSVCHHARYPAIPIIRNHFSDRFSIVLDDILREQEQGIVELWKQELDSTHFINDYRYRGISYGRKGFHYEV